MNIEIKGVYKKYKDTTIKYRDINIEKRVVIIKGENGSGKSTLLKAISGLIKYDGVIKSNDSISYMNELIELPQGVSLHEFINMFLKFQQYNIELLNTMLKAFQLCDKLESDVSTLSKGMVTKVAIVLCLLLDRDMYLMDEPLSGLDKKSIEYLIGYIKKSNKSYIISTHIKDILNEFKDGEVLL